MYFYEFFQTEFSTNSCDHGMAAVKKEMDKACVKFAVVRA